MQLKNLRNKIDALDEKILKLLNQRAGEVIKVSKFKKKKKLATFSPGREASMLTHLKKMNKGPFKAEDIENIFREILSVSRAQRAVLKISYLGPETTFTHIAALKRFGKSSSYVECKSIDDVFAEVPRVLRDGEFIWRRGGATGTAQIAVGIGDIGVLQIQRSILVFPVFFHDACEPEFDRDQVGRLHGGGSKPLVGDVGRHSAIEAFGAPVGTCPGKPAIPGGNRPAFYPVGRAEHFDQEAVCEGVGVGFGFGGMLRPAREQRLVARDVHQIPECGSFYGFKLDFVIASRDLDGIDQLNNDPAIAAARRMADNGIDRDQIKSGPGCRNPWHNAGGRFQFVGQWLAPHPSVGEWVERGFQGFGRQAVVQ